MNFIKHAKTAILISLSLFACGFAIHYLTPKAPSRVQHKIFSTKSSQQLDNKDAGRVVGIGYLTPEDGIIRLSPQLQSSNSVPLISKILVKESQPINVGQILVILTTRTKAESEIKTLRSNLAFLRQQLPLLEKEISRYRKLIVDGAFSAAQLDSKEFALLEHKAKIDQVSKRLDQAMADKELAVIRSPIKGIVLKINNREGEAPSPEGILQIGRSKNMQAIIQVGEENLKLLKLGQKASITSENGAFSGDARGTISEIAPMVTAQMPLTANLTQDPDQAERMINLKITLSSVDSNRLDKLTGSRVRMIVNTEDAE